MANNTRIPTDWYAALHKAIPTINFDIADGLWKRSLARDPDLDQRSDAEVARILGETAAEAAPKPATQAAAQPTEDVAKTSTAPTDAVQRATANGIPLDLKGPYAGTSQEAANPQNPNASSISQFDPAALQSAEAQRQALYAQNAPRRALSQFIAGTGGPQVSEEHRKAWGALDAENYARTVGLQEKLQSQATAAQAAATSAQAREESAGKFAGTQREVWQKLELGQFTVDQQRRINDSKSPETLSLKAMIPNILNKGNIDPATKEELLRIANNPNATAAQLAPILSTLAPEAMKAWLDSIKGREGEQDVRSKTAKADVDVGVRDALLGGPAPTAQGTTSTAAPVTDARGNMKNATPGELQVPPKEQLDRDRERLRILKQEYDKTTDPALKQSLLREMSPINKMLLRAGSQDAPVPTAQVTPQAAAPAPAPQFNELQRRLPFSSITGAGQTLSPDPRVTAGAANEASAAAKAEERFRAYDTELAPTITALKTKMQTVPSGKGTEMFARLFPGESRELVSLFNRFNALYPGTLQGGLDQGMAQSVAKEGFTGSIVSNLSTDQVNRMLQLIEGSAAKDRGYQQGINAGRNSGTPPGQYGANQPMPVTTPAPKPSGLPRVSTPEELDAVPIGSQFFFVPLNKVQTRVK